MAFRWSSWKASRISWKIFPRGWSIRSDDRQSDRFCRVVLEHHLELTIGEPPLLHLGSKRADSGGAGVLLRRLVLCPELGQEAVLGSDPADQVRPVFLERVSVVKLDPGAAPRSFLHLIQAHLAGQVCRVGRDHPLDTRGLGLAERE